MIALRVSIGHGTRMLLHNRWSVARPQLATVCLRAHSTAAEQIKAAEENIHTFMPATETKDHMAAIQEATTRNGDSLARVLLHDESEDAINQQINVEYTNCYLYHAMASYFARDSVALHGFAKYFREQSDDERGHAQLFMDFLSKRGGRVQLGALSAPPNDFSDEEKGDALKAMELALALEKLNFEKITELSAVAEKHDDAQFADFIDEMLQEQATEVKECADMVAQLRRIGKGFPVYEYDQALLKKE